MNTVRHIRRFSGALGIASVLLLSACGGDDEESLGGQSGNSSIQAASSVGIGGPESASSLSSSSTPGSSSSRSSVSNVGVGGSSSATSNSSSVPAASSSSATNLRDTSAPSVPTLSQTSLLSNSATIAWTPATDNTGVDAYRIYRNGVQIAQVNRGTLSYTDTGLLANTSYSYTVSAGDAAKNWSGASKALNLKTLMVSGKIKIEWHIPSARENGDYLELRDIGGYEIRYKLLSTSHYQSVVIKDGDADEYDLGYLAGDYEFQIASFDTNGLYSNFVPIYPN